MTLGQKQRTFTRMIGLLIEYAYQQGFELTVGDAYRDPRLHSHPRCVPLQLRCPGRRFDGYV